MNRRGFLKFVGGAAVGLVAAKTVPVEAIPVSVEENAWGGFVDNYAAAVQTEMRATIVALRFQFRSWRAFQGFKRARLRGLQIPYEE